LVYRDQLSTDISVRERYQRQLCLMVRLESTQPDVSSERPTIHDETPKPVASSVNVELLEYKVQQLEKQLRESESRADRLLDIVENQTLAVEHKSSNLFTRFIDKMGG
jgi:TolA-binding protein